MGSRPSELVERLGGSYRFLHDRVQEAAYALVPESERSHEHLRIGRLLVAHTPPERREETIFEIVNQLNRGATLMTSPDEREQLSRLNLIAGKRAKASAAYAAALDYFASGARAAAGQCLGESAELTFALELNRAECEFVTGDLASAEERLSIVAERATNLVDEGSVACLRIALYTVLRRCDRAIEIGLAYLSQGRDRVVAASDRRGGPRRTRTPVATAWEPPDRVALRPTRHVRSRDPTHDRRALRAPRIFALDGSEPRASAPAPNGEPEHAAWQHRRVDRRLRLPELVVGVRFGQYAAAYRFGLLAIDLVDKKGLDRAKTRVYWGVGAWVVPWVRHLREARPVLRRSLESCENWRPLPYYLMWIYSSLVTHGLASGEPLADVHHEAEEGRRRVTQGARKAALLDFMTGQLGFIRTLRG